MCWSANVSWAFASLDLVFVAILVFRMVTKQRQRQPVGNHNSPRHLDGTIALCLMSVALQEWAQWAVWKSGIMIRSDSTDAQKQAACTPYHIFLSFAASGAAQSIPLILIVSAMREMNFWRGIEYSSLATSSSDSQSLSPSLQQRGVTGKSAVLEKQLAQAALLCWLAQFAIIVMCVLSSGIYCVQLGKNHHQVWICASSVYAMGGMPLYLLILVLYILAAGCALEAMPLPDRERQWIQAIALTNGAVAYGLYCWTLEACSIWCWSAFSFGIYFCLRDYVMPDLTA